MPKFKALIVYYGCFIREEFILFHYSIN